MARTSTFARRGIVVMALVVMLLVPFMSIGAQAEELPVLILPVNNANFLPGALFDFRVEVHTVAELPENFAVTVNGTPAAEFFEAESTFETWEFGGNVTRFNNEGAAPADFAAEALAINYYNSTFGPVEVTVDGENLVATIGGEAIRLEPGDNPLIYTAVGGPADGQAVTFGYNEDGVLTGFQVAGQDFGVFSRQPTKSASVIWRDLSAPAAGDYVIEVTAGGTTETVTWTVREAIAGGARNVILFVADGMTVPLITAARAARGMEQGLPTNELFMDTMQYVGLASTSSVDSLMADSANTASALNTGHISSVNATGVYADTSPDLLDDPRVETLASILQRTRDYSIGVVTTADYSDATSAATWAHGRNRSDGNRAAYVVQSLEAGIDVLMGGGSRRLLPQSAEGSRRSDDRDMFAEFEAAGYSIATTATELDTLLTGDALPTQLLGLFHPSDLNVWLDRNVYTDNLGDVTDQPGLVDMTTAALQILNQNENGWYLTVEAASIDKQIHPLDQERALSDLIEFDQAIEAAAAWVAENAPDTLIVVTSDHGHGYEVFGTVDVETFNTGETDEERREAIRVYNAAGYPDYPDANGDGFPEWGDASIVFAGTVNNGPDRTENFQVSEVPRVPAVQNDEGVYIDNPDDDPNGIVQQGNLAPNSSTGVHTLQDVPVFAMGPGAELVQGSYHQREIFYVMASALGLDPSAEGGMVAVQPEVSTAGFTVSAANLALLVFGLIGGFALSRVGKKAVSS
jgi:alkaline phosphatase